MFTPSGTRDIASTPPPMVISQVPAWIRFAAKWIACWLEPHWRATVVAGGSCRKSRGQEDVAGDVAALLAHLVDAAEHNVLDERRLDTGAPHDLVQDERAQVIRVDAGQHAGAAAHGRADRLHNDG